jgi:hypothetical protein
MHVSTRNDELGALLAEASMHMLRFPEGFQHETDANKVRWLRRQLGYDTSYLAPSVVNEVLKPEKIYGYGKLTPAQKETWSETMQKAAKYHAQQASMSLQVENLKAQYTLKDDDLLVVKDRIHNEVTEWESDGAGGKRLVTRYELVPKVEKPPSRYERSPEEMYHIAPGTICNLRGESYKIRVDKWGLYTLYIRRRWWIFRWWKELMALDYRQLRGLEASEWENADALFRAYWDKEDEWWTTSGNALSHSSSTSDASSTYDERSRTSLRSSNSGGPK